MVGRSGAGGVVGEWEWCGCISVAKENMCALGREFVAYCYRVLGGLCLLVVQTTQGISA